MVAHSVVALASTPSARYAARFRRGMQKSGNRAISARLPEVGFCGFLAAGQRENEQLEITLSCT